MLSLFGYPILIHLVRAFPLSCCSPPLTQLRVDIYWFPTILVWTTIGTQLYLPSLIITYPCGEPISMLSGIIVGIIKGFLLCLKVFNMKERKFGKVEGRESIGKFRGVRASTVEDSGAGQWFRSGAEKWFGSEAMYLYNDWEEERDALEFIPQYHGRITWEIHDCFHVVGKRTCHNSRPWYPVPPTIWPVTWCIAMYIVRVCADMGS